MITSPHPRLFRGLLFAAIGMIFAAMAVRNMWKGSFRMKGRETAVTALDDPVRFWCYLSFFLLMGLVFVIIGLQELRAVKRRRDRKRER